jgi:hypothetical protein
MDTESIIGEKLLTQSVFDGTTLFYLYACVVCFIFPFFLKFLAKFFDICLAVEIGYWRGGVYLV